MARLTCKCGTEISNSNNPEVQYLIFSDNKWIELLDKLDEGAKLGNIGIGYAMISWKCPACERLYIFREGSELAARVYKIEESDGELL